MAADPIVQLARSLGRCSARLSSIERSIRELRRDLDEVIRAEDIATAVAGRLRDRNIAGSLRLEGWWLRAGIVALVVSTVSSVTALVLSL